jgi:ariadne-1
VIMSEKGEVIQPSVADATTDNMIQTAITEGKEEEREEAGILNPKHYKVLDRNELQEYQDQQIREANEILDLERPLVRLVLKHYRWDVERVVGEWLDKGRDLVLRIAGLDVQQDGDVAAAAAASAAVSAALASEEMECDICYGDMTPDMACAVSCGHCFCIDCWRSYLTLKINEEGQKAGNIPCMGNRCIARVDDTTIERVVLGEVFKKYKDSLLAAYVGDNPLLNWCPASRCGRAIKITTGNPQVAVTCACGHTFCFNCQHPPHAPSTCGMVKSWKHNVDTSKISQWLKSCTKTCPECGKAVEKDAGCNHITCSCGAHFCWVCGGLFCSTPAQSPLQPLGTHSCNAFHELPNCEDKDPAPPRLLHYATRYIINNKSRKREKRLEEQIQAKLEAAATGLDQPSLAHLQQSPKILAQCRDILGWSYVFAFYMFDVDCHIPSLLDPFKTFADEEEMRRAKQQFEVHQEELQLATECLSGMLEKLKSQPNLQTNDYWLSVINATKLARDKFYAIFRVADWIRTQGATGTFPDRPIEATLNHSNYTNKNKTNKNKKGYDDDEDDRGKGKGKEKILDDDDDDYEINKKKNKNDDTDPFGAGYALDDDQYDEQLRAALEASMKEQGGGAGGGGGGRGTTIGGFLGGGSDDDEDLEKVLALSMMET